MATLFGRMRSISRGAGSSAMTAAAYRSCSQLTRIITDKETGIKSDITYDYTDKKGLVYSKIFAPDIELADGTKVETPAWVFDRQNLWQRVEDIETRVNSELAKEYVVALPKEFSVEQNIKLLQEFVETSFLSRGMIVDVNYHGDNPENPHAHIMFPMRMLELNEQGEIDFGGKVREWKAFAMLQSIKQEQQIIINNHYAKNGFEFHLQWGTSDGLESTFHHGGIKNLWLRNQEILERNASRIIADPSLIIDKLDHNKSAFTSEDIEKEIENALQINLRHIESDEYLKHKKSLEVYLQTEKLKMLDTVLLSPKLTVVNNCDLKGRTLFAKTKQVELEKRFVSHIETLHSKDNHAIHIAEKDIKPLGTDKNGKIIEFTQQQKEVIRKTLAGKNISIIEGWPGAGKTTVTKEIVRHYQKRGYTVMAAAPTNKAAQELENKLGIKAYTAAALRMKWQLERGYKTDISLKSDYYREEAYQNTDPVMQDKTVLIIDEISMIDTSTFDYFAAEIARSGNKLIGLGDNNQNQAIGMKGAAAKAIDIAGSNLLTEINRHRNTDTRIQDLHIEASTALSRYQVPKALSIYEQLGAIKLHENEELKEQAIFSSYMEKLFDIAEREKIPVSIAASKIGMIAYTNAEIDRLNVMVRDSLKRSGVLSARGNSFLSGGLHGKGNMVELCDGDQIIFKSNQIEEEGYGGVMNNEIATVRKIVSCSANGKGEFVADINRNGKVKTVVIKTAEDGRPISFRHAYAITNYAVQGSSIDHILMSIDKHSGYEVTLVGLTRHILSCKIFAARDTLENEVFRTKDLDVNKVRAEFNAISYKWLEKTNEDGKKYFEKEDVPLWKIGLRLLASKRTDLNFAIDHSYGKKNQTDNLSAIYAKIGSLRGDLDKQTGEIYKFELQANSLVELEDNSQGKANQQQQQQPYSQMELFAAEHFKLEAGDVMFDVRSVMKSPALYKQINFDEISSVDHAEALKTGILKNGTRIKLKWNDLSELDQNLVLHSYLDKEDKEQLSEHIDKIEKLEHQIKQVSSEHAGVFAEMSEHSKSSHKDLTGNHGAVRDYLEARTNAREGYKIVHELNSCLNSHKIQKLLIADIKAKYKINFQILPTKIQSIVAAEEKFIKRKEEFDAKKQEENPNFKPETDLAKYRQNYLRSITNKNKIELNQKNLDLYLFDVLSNTENKELSDFWDKAETAQFDLDKTLEARQATALALINNYHQGIQSENKQPSIGKLLAQLNLNYQTIAKHARVSDEGHYFAEIAKGSALADRHYGKIMELIEKATSKDLTIENAKSLLESHYELAVGHELLGEYLTDLRSQRISVIEQKNGELKLLQKHKLFKTTEFNSYIGHIYKTNRLEVIENLDNLLNKTGDKKQLLLAISQSPEMLGELQNRGIIAKIFKSAQAQHVDEKLGIFGDNLKRYVEGYAQMEEIQSRLDGKYFQEKLKNIDLEIGKLQSQIASSKETEFLEEISSMESAATHHGKLNEQKFATSVSELFREDKTLDLLFNWQSYKAKISEKKSVENQPQAELAKEEKTYQQKIERLDFNEVANSLSSMHYESIFRQYASCINPDGKIVKKGRSISSGSLNMNLQNGLWNRFSSGESGNIFGFVSHATGVDKREALEIVADIAGIRPSSSYIDKKPIKTFEQIKQNEARVEMKEEWVASIVIKADAPVFNPEEHLSFMLKNNKLTASYEYRNTDNQLLGYAVRLEDKVSGKKQVLPVAYCENSSTKEESWRLKGFNDSGYKPIYGAEKLHAEMKPILIVEGEKTAEAAQKLTPDHTVISWMGGSKAVDKVNWQNLKGREVIIWPDNDQPGIMAAENIKEHIDYQNNHKGLCSIVDTASLNLPEKWDLADKAPEGLDVKAEISKSLQHNYSKPNMKNIELLESFDLLKAKGEIDISGIHSTELYKKSLALIAGKDSVKLDSNKGLAEQIQNLQDQYSELASQYSFRYPAQKDMTKQEAIQYELEKEAGIFHQLQTNTSKLPRVDQEHICSTVSYLVSHMKYYQKADIQDVGKKLDTELNSNNWSKQLFEKHESATKLAKAKLKAADLTEFTKLIETADPKLMSKIESASNFLKKQAGKDAEQLLKLYKIHGSSNAIHDALIKECKKHNYGIMKQQLKAIDQGKSVKLGGKEFTCQKAYLEHLHEHGKHDFLPRQQIKATLVKIKHQELEMHKQQQIAGPGM